MSECKHKYIARSTGDCMECGVFIPWHDRPEHAIPSREVLPATECAECVRVKRLNAGAVDLAVRLEAERDEAIAACALAMRDFDAGGLHHLSAEAAGELRAVLAKAKGRAE